MTKRKFSLTEAEGMEVLQAYRAGQDAGTGTRYQAVRLYGGGSPETEMEQIGGV